jgi:hypothetical protein
MNAILMADRRYKILRARGTDYKRRLDDREMASHAPAIDQGHPSLSCVPFSWLTAPPAFPTIPLSNEKVTPSRIVREYSMAEARMSLPVVRGFGETTRRDFWWVQPLTVFIVLSAFIVYATWAAFQGNHYTFGPYLSPFYSPELFGDSEHSWFGPKPSWWPAWLIFSPALLILWAPGGFRFTCYYYRGAYYKAFWADPPSCAVGEPRKSYWGERTLPLVLQNTHRYFLYLAILFLFFLGWDAIKSYWFENSFGVGVGSLVLTLNVILLGGYTLGCHSLRHLVGGRIDQLTRAPAQHRAYNCVSCLNRWHSVWAWLSLFWVAFSDLYIRLCSMGVWTDWRII